jgi:protein SCO1/2
MNKKFAWIGLVSLGLLVIAIFFLTRTNQINRKFYGSLIVPPVPAADFQLTNQIGEKTKLSDYRGKYLMIFFGFTSCTDECPAAMAFLREIRIGLGDQAALAQIVFISTDPVRDTPQAVNEFINRFDTTSIGFTGTLSELELVWKEYGVTVLDGGETHSTRIYLVDPEGNLRLTYPSASNPDEIISDIKSLISEK